MGYDKGGRGNRGGRGRDKRDDFGGGSSDFGGGSSFGGGGFGGGGFGGGDRGGFGGGSSFGGGDRGGFGGGGGGGFRGGGGGGFGGGGGGGFSGGGRGMPPQVVGEGTGVVKFFNAQKGFGFVVRDDGGEDVFVHISAVEQAGMSALAEGQPLGFTLVDRGGRISATELKIDGEPMAVTERAPREPREGGFGDRGPRPAAGGAGGPQRQLTGEKATGTVKFFNAMKGFGFIQRDDGQPDAFVHISAVERAGMSTLNEGDKLQFELEVDRRGKYAAVNLSAA
ncbi:cold-shock protein [Sphingomonas sp. UBA978]|uniref:cold-shock protein n=1 Tax=Sphingomonas sp. UBA978 TaxID=1947536 RepID=UPI0025CE1BFE|nr:cold-shock protein [Sphingomonas sp. UBA978]